MAYPYIGTGYHGGAQSSVKRIVIHGTVSPTVKGGARSVARYFQSPNTGGSAHYVVDPGEIVQCVKEGTVAYHAPPNTGSIGIELCDPQKGSASRWGDAGHEAMLRLAAKLTREVAARWDVPLKRLTVADLKAGRRGICGHVDVANAFHQTDHSDPGTGFPWAHFMDLVNGEDDMPSANELWDRKYSQKDSPVDGWQMDSIAANNNVRLRQIADKLNAQSAVITELAATVATLAANPEPVDVDALVQRITDAVENVTVRLEVEDPEPA